MEDMKTTMAGEPLSLDIIRIVLQDVVKRWYLVVVAVLVVAMGTYVYVDYSYRPEYRTTTTFVATAGSANATTYQNLSAASNLATVFTEVLNSSILREKVMAEVGIQSFDGQITATAIAETNLLTVTVSGSNPRTVFLMSMAIMEHHGIVSQQVLGSTVLEVLQKPTVPAAPINAPNTMAQVKKLSMVTAIGVCALLAALSYLSDKVRSKEEADRKLNCRVLGQLMHVRKYKSLRDRLRSKKKSILITDSATSFLYTNSIHKLASRVDKNRHRGEHVLMVTSLLENEGKSTVAANLALSMVKRGKRVLLIDCDMRKPACSLIFQQLTGKFGIVEILQGKAQTEDCVRKLEDSGLYLLPCRKSLRTATDLIDSAAMQGVIKWAARNFDFVVVDTPPLSVAPDAECLSEFVDASLLVIRQNRAYANDLNEAVGILEKAKSHLLGCVLNDMTGTANNFTPAFHGSSSGRYGRYSKYGRYGRYGHYGYGKYSQ